LPEPEGKTVVYNFEGPTLHVYTTLAVRLSHSGVFAKKDMWKNAATYVARVGGTCGMFLQGIEDARGELTLFFDRAASEETRFQFEEYVRTHLQRRAIPESVKRRRILECQSCGELITDRQANRRRELGHVAINCPVCETAISLLDYEDRFPSQHVSSIVLTIDRSADTRRTQEKAASTLQGKIATADFDVFLCHNVADKPIVKSIGERLKLQSILPWLDEWELQPGIPWQRLLEQQIKRIKSAAVFVGREGLGPWQHQEIEAFLREFVHRVCPVIPVFLPDASSEPELPVFLRGITWVDFRRLEPDPIERLIWGITGRKTFA
jgi:hypothetical protein